MGENEKKLPICNLCGCSCALSDGADAPPVETNAGLLEARVDGGYYSTAGNGYGALDDGTSYEFSMCEFCLDWLFSQFTVPVKMFDYMGSGDFTHDGVELEEKFRPAFERVNADEWRRMKDEFFAEHDKRAKAREEKMKKI